MSNNNKLSQINKQTEIDQTMQLAHKKHTTQAVKAMQAMQERFTGGDFARSRRIVKTDEFSSVFRLRPLQRTEHFVLYARPNNLENARLGVVVAKRFAPRAATRNMIKRVTREIFRQSPLVNVDCIVRLSKPVNKKADPAINAQIKRALRVEVIRLFASQRKVETVDAVKIVEPAAVVSVPPP